MEATRRNQTKAALGQGLLRLVGSEDQFRQSSKMVLSPYFQSADTRKVGPARDIQSILDLMIKAYYLGYSIDGPTADINILLEDTTGTYTTCVVIPLTITTSDTAATIRAAVPGAVTSWATSNGITINSAEWLIAGGVPNAPQAAIADAPADAVTNYNTITTLLGAVTGAVNAANTKQNDIATKLNSLLGELRTLGLISP